MSHLCSRASETLALAPSLDRMIPELHGWQAVEANFVSSAPLWTSANSVGARQPSLVDTLDWFAPPTNEQAPLASAFDSNSAQVDALDSLDGQLTWSEADFKSAHTAPLNTAQSAPDSRGRPQTSESGVNRASVADEGTRPTTATGSRYTTERKLLKNREAQKRFRQRHKARNHDTEAQLAATTAELGELRERQRQLEARNILLEKISYLSNKKSTDHGLNETRPVHGAYSAAHPFLNNLPAISISLPGQQRTLSTQQATDMSLQQFAALYTDYNREIGTCMLHLKEHEDPSILARMQDLAIEALNVTGRTMLKPTNHRAILNSRLDDATPVSRQPGKAFYQGVLAVFDLSEAQSRDLMYMRRLNLTKRATLSTERRVLMHAMAASEAKGLRNRSDNLSCLSQLAAQLQQNTADDRQVYYKLARAMFKGVLTSQQIAESMVHAYPYIAVVETLLDTLAEIRGELSKDEIAAMAPLNPMVAQWEDFVEYVAQLDRVPINHGHVPVLLQI